MAGTSYFNSGNRVSSSNSPFYQIKPLPLTTKTNTEYFSSNSTVQKQGLDVWRTGAANKNFLLSTSSSLVLRTINSNGTTTTVTTTNSASYTGGSGEYSVFHLNTADQCLYCLIRQSTTYALIKIGDASGIATAIGGSFTPATPANWPQQYSADRPTMFVNGSGNIEITYRGFKHQLNKSTGAIISQDVAISVGSYSAIGCDYLTADGLTAASSFNTQSLNLEANSVSIPRIVNTSSGIIEMVALSISDIFNSRKITTLNDILNIVRVDSDKMYLGSIVPAAPNPFGYIYTSDYDQFLQSVVDWYIGV